MPLTNDSIIWTGKSVGVTLENYNGIYSIKVTRKWMQQGEEKLSYDWIYPEVYDPEAKKRVVASKPQPRSVYLGDKEQAIQALHSMLVNLGAPSEPIVKFEEDDIPF